MLYIYKTGNSCSIWDSTPRCHSDFSRLYYITILEGLPRDSFAASRCGILRLNCAANTLAQKQTFPAGEMGLFS